MVARHILLRNLLCAASVIVCALLAGCSERKRPYGYLRLGPLTAFQAPESYLPDMRLLVRHDERGFSVMSTVCTYDLSPLRMQEKEGERRWVSSYTAAEYSFDGTVLHGPAKAPLPHYRLEIAPESVGSPPNFLYVYVGDEVSREWRLTAPLALECPRDADGCSPSFISSSALARLRAGNGAG